MAENWNPKWHKFCDNPLIKDNPACQMYYNLYLKKYIVFLILRLNT